MTLKLKRTPGLYLVGFMGTGKSTVGKLLASELGWPFIDIDEEIEKQEGKLVVHIFEERGESAFRALETDMIRRHVHAIQAGMPSVLALGGGAFVQKQNWEILENNGVTVWIDSPFNILQQRLDGDTTRPLARDPQRFHQLFLDRREFYKRADFHVEVAEEDATAVVQRILSLPIF